MFGHLLENDVLAGSMHRPVTTICFFCDCGLHFPCLFQTQQCCILLINADTQSTHMRNIHCQPSYKAHRLWDKIHPFKSPSLVVNIFTEYTCAHPQSPTHGMLTCGCILKWMFRLRWPYTGDSLHSHGLKLIHVTWNVRSAHRVTFIGTSLSLNFDRYINRRCDYSLVTCGVVNTSAIGSSYAMTQLLIISEPANEVRPHMAIITQRGRW